MARIKHVTNDVYHLWANQSYANLSKRETFLGETRNISENWAHNASRNRSFRELEAKSYRTVVARIVTSPNGTRGYLISSASYSSTTARHLSEIRYAVRDLGPIFTVDPYATDNGRRYGYPNVPSTDAETLDTMRNTLRNMVGALPPCLKDGSNGVRRTKSLERIAAQVAEYNRFPAFLEMGDGFFNEYLAPDIAERLAEIAAREQAKRDAELAARAARAREAAQEIIGRWINGENVYIPHTVETAYLRLTDDGATVQTSHNATVPTDHVLRVFPLIMAAIANGTVVDGAAMASTVHLGHYALKSVSANGNVTVGCHYFERSEIERFADVLRERFPSEVFERGQERYAAAMGARSEVL